MHQLLKQLTQLSRAAKFASLCCVLLLLLTLLAWIIFQFDPARVAWSDYMTISRGVMLGALLAMTTGAIYFSARFWLDETPASIDEVESAWRTGLDALSKVGLSIVDLPVYLFVGATTTEQQRQLVNAANQKLVVEAPARADAPLNWFATDQAIYLFCGSAGVLGRTVDQLKKTSGRYQMNEEGALGSLTAQPDVQLLGSAAAESVQCSAGSQNIDYRGEDGASAAERPQALARSEHSCTATLVRPQLAVPSLEVEAERQFQQLQLLIEEQLQLERTGLTVVEPTRVASLTSLTSTETAAGQQMLADVCVRLRGQRRPMAPINGIGVVLDIAVVTSSESAARQCGDAIHGELEQLRSLLGQLAPISLVCTGMEHQPGVSEAIRRLGATAASLLPLGHITDPREVISRQLTERSVEQALLSIEKLVHQLIRSPESISIPGNSHLIRLLINCRQRFSRPLRILLNQALLASSVSVSNQSQPAFLNGLFFAAIGNRPIERAFTAPLFNRLQAQQHWLAWTTAELQMQKRERLLSRSLAIVCVIEVIALVVQVWC